MGFLGGVKNTSSFSLKTRPDIFSKSRGLPAVFKRSRIVSSPSFITPISKAENSFMVSTGSAETWAPPIIKGSFIPISFMAFARREALIIETVGAVIPTNLGFNSLTRETV